MAQYHTSNPYYNNFQYMRIFNLLEEYKRIVFKEGRSFFDENTVINKQEVFKEFETRTITNFDASDDNSLSKYTRQLDGSSKEFRHYFACIVWLYHFFIKNDSKKRETKINEVYQFLNNTVSKDQVSEKTPEDGIISYGNLFHSKYYDIAFIHFFMKKYFTNNSSEIDAVQIIDSLDLIKNMNYYTKENLDNKSTVPSEHLLKYAFNPEYYEPIGAREHKQKIVTYFLGSYNNDCLDEDLFNIRHTNGFDVSYYDILEDISKLPLKERTKTDLQTAVLRTFYQQRKPLNIKEIVEYIIDNNLYDYGEEKYIEPITKSLIEKHCDNVDRVDSSKRKFYKKVDNQKYYVLDLMDDALAPDENEHSGDLEGSKKQVVVNSYERSRKNREMCLKIHGYQCKVCSIDFERIYGQRGEKFIHVHHINSLSHVQGEHIINPETDLVPLCPNCHSMIHRYKDNIAIKDLKEMISNEYLNIVSAFVKKKEV